MGRPSGSIFVAVAKQETDFPMTFDLRLDDITQINILVFIHSHFLTYFNCILSSTKTSEKHYSRGEWLYIFLCLYIDPLDRPTGTAGSDLFSITSVSSFHNLVKRNKFQVKTMFASGGTGRGDHWWHLSCSFLCSINFFIIQFSPYFKFGLQWPLRGAEICLKSAGNPRVIK